MRALDNQRVDAIVVGGVGAGALSGLNRMGITVRRAMAATVRENLACSGRAPCRPSNPTAPAPDTARAAAARTEARRSTRRDRIMDTLLPP